MIYVASSWKNMIYDSVVQILRAAKLDVYDFKHPIDGDNGFHWSEIDENWAHWNPALYRQKLEHPLAERGFRHDMTALMDCEKLVMVLPCGASSHLELGYAIGAGKPTFIYYPSSVHIEPELMYKAATKICLSIGELLEALEV